METKINIVASQGDNGLFNLVISKVTAVENDSPIMDNSIKTELTFEQLKAEINNL
jgi:hypothetical protein